MMWTQVLSICVGHCVIVNTSVTYPPFTLFVGFAPYESSEPNAFGVAHIGTTRRRFPRHSRTLSVVPQTDNGDLPSLVEMPSSSLSGSPFHIKWFIILLDSQNDFSCFYCSYFICMRAMNLRVGFR